MKMRVKLFAVAKELAGQDEVRIEVNDGATIDDVRAAVEHKFPALRNILRHTMWAVDGQYAADNVKLTETSEIAIIPPVSGG
jgi:molybdopterin converting factor subunit 1